MIGSRHVFKTLVELVVYHSLHRGVLPCRLLVPLDDAPASPPASPSADARPARRELPVPAFNPFAEPEPAPAEAESGPPPCQPPRVRRAAGISAATLVRPDWRAGPGSSERRKTGSIATSIKSLFSRHRSCSPCRAVPPLIVCSNKPGRVAKHVARLLRHLIATPSALNSTIANFIVCTKDAVVAEPAALARNIRQFFDGLRNFIIAQYGARVARTTAADARRV